MTVPCPRLEEFRGRESEVSFSISQITESSGLYLGRTLSARGEGSAGPLSGDALCFFLGQLLEISCSSSSEDD